jgi:sulfoxide reductase catalytic subunit YedY
MLIKTRKKGGILSSEITPLEVYQSRRSFLKELSVMTGSFLLSNVTVAKCLEPFQSSLNQNEKLNTFSEITHYNNFYEFSTNKQAIAELAKNLQADPWTISIEGEVEKPLILDIDSLIKRTTLVDRIYRLRCVEGWSMVIPWQGIPLCQILKQAQPTSKAHYVEFVAKHDPSVFYGQRQSVLEWPYREGLRIDEAMNPLTLLATGLYGKNLPNQNGAPIRLVVPWKYGFKSIKSIVKIRIRESQPVSSWQKSSPGEYGFYANVNPNVSHSRWSQRRENRIGEFSKRRTLAFNGYEEEVAHLYKGMDLKINY